MTNHDALPDCCNNRGLFYPGRVKRCHRHATPDQRALTAELDARADKSAVLNGQGWPYGPNIDVESRDRLLDWAERHDLRLAKTRCQGMHWLIKGRCGVNLCNRLRRWMDHVTRWNRDGKPALVIAQPYGLSGQDMIELGRLAADDTLHLSVDAQSWYGWGTVAVEVWNADAYRRFLDDPKRLAKASI